jgi:cytochrome P450
MTFIVNCISKFFMTIIILLNGLFSLLGLIFRGIGAAFGSGGTWKSRIAAVLTAPEGQRLVFSFLRAYIPNLAIGKVLVKAYENTGTAVISRNDDVKEVVNRDADFEVVCGPRMREITGGENFFLGMQNTPQYTRDTSNMRIAMRRDDVPSIIAPMAAKRAEEIVAGAGGKLDLPQDLTLRIPALMVAEYFGTPGPSEKEMMDWTTIMFWYLFIDLQADPDTIAKAKEAARNCCAYLDKAIAERKANPTDADDVLNRCLEMQRAGIPGMDDLGIRNNMIGMLIGAIPTISKASTQIMDQLFDRPDALEIAQTAARADNDEELAASLFEAFRFNPINPVIYRRAARDTMVARGTLRARRIKKGTLVFAANFSAMFDPLKIDAPNSFRVDRPWEDYMLWGYAMHTCSGAYINRPIIPALLKPLLQRRNLRRADGPAGQIDTAGTPFPVHMHVVFDSD